MNEWGRPQLACQCDACQKVTASAVTPTSAITAKQEKPARTAPDRSSAGELVVAK